MSKYGALKMASILASGITLFFVFNSALLALTVTFIGLLLFSVARALKGARIPDELNSFVSEYLEPFELADSGGGFTNDFVYFGGTVKHFVAYKVNPNGLAMLFGSGVARICPWQKVSLVRRIENCRIEFILKANGRTGEEFRRMVMPASGSFWLQIPQHLKAT